MTSVEPSSAVSNEPQVPGRRVDPSELTHIEIIETNERHASAPPFKKLNYIKERCECKRYAQLECSCWKDGTGHAMSAGGVNFVYGKRS
jgi:hypothetical protein